MLALYDCRDTPRFLIAVNSGWRSRDAGPGSGCRTGHYEDTFRLVVSSGEPEVVLRDAMFKNVCVISPKGVFVSEEN